MKGRITSPTIAALLSNVVSFIFTWMTSQQRAIKQMRCEASHQIGNTPKRICHWATKSHKLVNENVSTMLGKQWYDECGIFHMHTHTNTEHKSTSSEGGRHARMPFDGKKKKKTKQRVMNLNWSRRWLDCLKGVEERKWKCQSSAAWICYNFQFQQWPKWKAVVNSNWHTEQSQTSIK